MRGETVYCLVLSDQGSKYRTWRRHRPIIVECEELRPVQVNWREFDSTCSMASLCSMCVVFPNLVQGIVLLISWGVTRAYPWSMHFC